ncbi:Peroxidase 39 [Linum perenne]
MERLSFSMALLVMVALVLVGSTNAQLKMGFYSKSCPKAEKIIQDFVHQKISTVPSLAATFIRMHFHDCFVRGCDASVLLNTTSGEQPEKQSPPNLTLRGFDFIDRVKSLVEAECPGVVSCADVLTLVTRDSIVAVGGPSWRVPTGRRDGVISRSSEARNNIPPPFANFTTLQTLFANQGLDVKDLVLLSGRGDADPALDSDYASNLRSRKCRTINDNTTKVEMDPGSRNTFDLSYYSLLLKRRGLFESDAALTTNSASLQLVDKIAKGSVKDFFSEFALAMEKMGRINVKTGSNGEIRKQCALVN